MKQTVKCFGAVLIAAFAAIMSVGSAVAEVAPAANGGLAFSRGQSVGWGNSTVAHRINVIPTIGANAKVVTDGGGNSKTDDWHPAFSWSGSKIAFTRYRGPGDADIFTMNPDGSQVNALTSGPGHKTDAEFTTDDKRIIYTSDQDGDMEVYSIGIDGNGGKQLTKNSVDDTSPSVDRDGYIYFQRNFDIYRMNPDGANILQMTDNPALDSQPSTSRTGNIVAFSSNRDGNWEIYSMKPDGSAEKRLTNDPKVDQCADVSPDGKVIAFCTTRYSTNDDPWGYDIATVGTAGGVATRITFKKTTDVEPSWQPAPILFPGTLNLPVFQVPPIVSTTIPLSPNPSLTPSVKGSSSLGTTVKLFKTGNCSGNPVATGPADKFNSVGLQVQVTPGSTTTFRATATNGVNVSSVCSPTSVTYTHEEQQKER